MKFLTIDYIKQHSRIDFDCEDGVLATYGASAENTLLAYIRRTLDNVRDMNDGDIPPDMYHAALMLTEQAYNHRGPVSPTNMSVVGYAFDMKVKPLMRLDGRTNLQAERDTLLEMLDGVHSDLDFDYAQLSEPTDEQTEAYDGMVKRICHTRADYMNVMNPTAKICATLRTQLADIKTQCEEIFKTE
jgi:hypothetical protein